MEIVIVPFEWETPGEPFIINHQSPTKSNFVKNLDIYRVSMWTAHQYQFFNKWTKQEQTLRKVLWVSEFYNLELFDGVTAKILSHPYCRTTGSIADETNTCWNMRSLLSQVHLTFGDGWLCLFNATETLIGLSGQHDKDLACSYLATWIPCLCRSSSHIYPAIRCATVSMLCPYRWFQVVDPERIDISSNGDSRGLLIVEVSSSSFQWWNGVRLGLESLPFELRHQNETEWMMSSCT